MLKVLTSRQTFRLINKRKDELFYLTKNRYLLHSLIILLLNKQKVIIDDIL